MNDDRLSYDYSRAHVTRVSRPPSLYRIIPFLTSFRRRNIESLSGDSWVTSRTGNLLIRLRNEAPLNDGKLYPWHPEEMNSPNVFRACKILIANENSYAAQICDCTTFLTRNSHLTIKYVLLIICIILFGIIRYGNNVTICINVRSITPGKIEATLDESERVIAQTYKAGCMAIEGDYQPLRTRATVPRICFSVRVCVNARRG